MAITTYGELKTAAANFLTRADLTERIPEFVALGESRLFTQLRVREMEATSNISTTSTQREDPLPTRFVKARYLYVAATPNVRLEYRSPVEFWSIWSNLATASPIAYTIEQDAFAWGAIPDATYTITVGHYARMAAFSADSDTNAVIARWPGLYLYPTLLEAAPYLGNDPRVTIWAGLYETLLADAHAADKADRYSGDAVVPDRYAQMT
ncbi:MAG: phage adaptor protein [Alphaproteobacteria bacterium]